MNLAEAKAIRAQQAIIRDRQQAEFKAWRPTPTRQECNAGEVVLFKDWDLSPIDALSFNPAEPPGRPDDGRPVVVAPPLITGLARVGDLLTASTGTWTNAPTGFTYQWRRGPYDIKGATAASYVPIIADLAWPLSVRVTASNAIGQAAATSLATALVSPAAPVCMSVPIVTGEAAIGELLTANPGAWYGSPTSYLYQWMRDLAEIAGEIGPAYTPDAADEGFTLRVGVQGVNAGGAGSLTFSTAVGPIGQAVAPLAPPINLTLPVILGITAVGQTLTSSVGSWANAPDSYARQWRRDGIDIAGAQGVAYLLDAADLGAMISVAVTATNVVGSTTAISDEVGPVMATAVEAQPPENTLLPVITGMTLVGEALTCSTGTWTDGPWAFAYEWRRGADIIAGATAATLVLVPLDRGFRIYCRVTATNTAGSSVAQTADAGPTIGAGLPYCTDLPVVTGDPRSGVTLSTTDGVWTNGPVTFTYNWTRNGLRNSIYESTFDLTDREITRLIASRVTATNALGSSSFNSAPVGPVVPADAP
jgi:hypothetical protein